MPGQFAEKTLVAQFIGADPQRAVKGLEQILTQEQIDQIETRILERSDAEKLERLDTVLAALKASGIQELRDEFLAIKQVRDTLAPE